MRAPIPALLTALRALLAPILVVLALCCANRIALGACLVVAFLSDVFDGIIARHLQVATPTLRRFDSVADTIFYLAALFAAWHLYPSVFQSYRGALVILGALELARYAFDFTKFNKEAAYHMWSSKVWGVLLFSGFFSLLALGKGGLLVGVAIYAGIAVDLEGLAISMVLREWTNDVPSIVHAVRLRRAGAR
jgi:CDP-diacylglycerol--glycerol-3-phosphate 3-phosphatidyltransferase